MVRLARLSGASGFGRTLAIKALHPAFASDSDLRAMLVDEARLSARVSHPNVVSILDVLLHDREIFLVMDYVHGVSLATLSRGAAAAGLRLPVGAVTSIGCDVLYGLHAAHEATGEGGAPLSLVHRDVSPQNVMVGFDGVARAVDFGIAKAVGRLQQTRTGEIKGKLSYMAPEQRRGEASRATDLWAVGVVLWEVLAGRSVRELADVAEVGARLPPLRSVAPKVPEALEAVVERATRSAPEERFTTAREMASALAAASPPLPHAEVADHVVALVPDWYRARCDLVERVEAEDEARAGAEMLERADEETVSLVGAPAEQTVDVVTPPSTPLRAHAADDERSPPATTSARAPRRARWVVLAAALPAVAALAGAAAVFGAGSRSEPHPPDVPAHPSALTPPPSPSPPPAATMPALDVDPAPLPVAASAPVVHATASSPPAARPRAACDPPYTVDANGRRRYRRECLR